MKIAVSSYSFTQALRAGRMTFLDIIPKAKEFGFDGIEYVPLGMSLEDEKELAVKLAAQAKEYGIEICSYLIGNDFLNAGESFFENIFLRWKVKNTCNFQIGAVFADDFINALSDCAIS